MITSPEEFIALLASDDPQVNKQAAHVSASEEIWLNVIEKYPRAKKWVAHNKTVPNSILQILAGDSDPEVRWWVAMKRRVDPSILEKLASDPNEGVRLRVAYNKKTPSHILH